MAFPTIPTVAAGRVLTAVQANTTATRTFPDLSSLTKNSGDLLIAIIIAYQSSVTPAFSTWGGGFTEFFDSGSGSTLAIGAAYKWSTGSETGTFTVTQAATITGHAAMILLAIPGAHASTAPEAGSRADGTSAAADPASFNPAGWDAEDTLWLAVRGSGETSTTGSYTGLGAAPTNYSDSAQTGISGDVVGGVEAGVSFRQLNSSSEDVGAGTCDTSNARNSAFVIAVRPAPAAVSFNAEPGSFSLTGQAAGVPAGRAVNAAPTSYALTGTAATVPAARVLDSSPAGYAVSGATAGAVAGRSVTASPGAFDLTGFLADFQVGSSGFELDAQPGVYALTGAAAGTAAGRSLVASPAGFTVTGADGTVLAGRAVNAAAGAVAVTGAAATLHYGVGVTYSATQLAGPRDGLEWS